MEVNFRRSRSRIGTVPVSTKLYQGLGALPGGHKDWAFNTVLLLYYSQILGIPASYAGIVLAIALVLDAITDPMVGAYTDNFRSRFGRRHPFMLAAALPVSLAMYFLLSPPEGASVAFLTGWMLVFTLTVRVAFTFFAVPWNAVAAELSEDYRERTSIIIYRILVGWVGGVIFIFVMFSLVFPATPVNENGLLVQSNYRVFGIVVPLLMLLWMLLTTVLTRGEVQYLPQPTDRVPAPGLRDSVVRIGTALRSRNFRLILFATLLFSGIAGTGQVFDTYMNLYFWEFKSADLRWFSLSIAGAFLSFMTAGVLQRHLEKQQIVVIAMTLTMLLMMLKVTLRFLDLWPDNGDPLLLYLFIGHLIVVVYCLNTALIMFASMIPDMVDEQEVVTGLRQEGVFASSVSFANKATSSVGLIAGGFLLDFVVRFPRGTQPGEIDADVLFRLAFTDGIGVTIFYLLPIILMLRYSLTEGRLDEIQGELKARQRADAG